MAPPGFDDTYAAIKAMIRRDVLHTRLARGVARKAGLKRGVISPPPRPVTLIDAFCILEAPKDEDEEGAPYSWEIDLSPYTHARVTSTSDWQTRLVYSLNLVGTTDYMVPSVDPESVDWDDILGTLDEPGHPFDGGSHLLSGTWSDLGFGFDPRTLGWTVLPEVVKQPIRVAIAGPGNPGELPRWPFDSSPFIFTLQAK